MPASLQRSRLEFAAAASLTTAVILFTSWLAVVAFPARDEAALQEILRFENSIQLGMDVEEARKQFDAAGYRYLKWVSRYHPYFVVKPPPRAGAYQWVVWLEDRGGKVVGIRTREWKGENIHHGDSPPDRVLAETSHWPDGLAYKEDF